MTFGKRERAPALTRGTLWIDHRSIHRALGIMCPNHSPRWRLLCPHVHFGNRSRQGLPALRWRSHRIRFRPSRRITASNPADPIARLRKPLRIGRRFGWVILPAAARRAPYPPARASTGRTVIFASPPAPPATRGKNRWPPLTAELRAIGRALSFTAGLSPRPRRRKTTSASGPATNRRGGRNGLFTLFQHGERERRGCPAAARVA